MSDTQGKFELGFRALMGMVISVGVIVLMFFAARAIFTVLAWAAPVLFIATLIVNYQTVVNFGKWLWNLLMRNPLMGILAIVLIGFGFPVVAAFLFGKSFLDRKVRLMLEEKKRENDFVEYEDVTEEDGLDLRELERRENRESFLKD